MPTPDNILWHVENHFRDAVTLDDIAAASGLSKSHISRMFAHHTGHKFSDYVRKRRLSIAAQQMADGAPDILQVAIEAGYNSHEAFTRAFRAAFGTTPEAVRLSGTTENLDLLEPLRMDTAHKTPLPAPRLMTSPAMRLAGLKNRYQYTSMAGIPDQWQQFVPWFNEISVDPNVKTYGVIIIAENDPEGFDYFCGLEIGVADDVPADLVSLDVPEMRVAAFRHERHVSELAETCNAIFSDAMPQAGLQPSGPIEFLEVYGPEFDARTGLGGLDVWVNLGPPTA